MPRAFSFFSPESQRLVREVGPEGGGELSCQGAAAKARPEAGQTCRPEDLPARSLHGSGYLVGGRVDTDSVGARHRGFTWEFFLLVAIEPG